MELWERSSTDGAVLQSFLLLLLLLSMVALLLTVEGAGKPRSDMDVRWFEEKLATRSLETNAC